MFHIKGRVYHKKKLLLRLPPPGGPGVLLLRLPPRVAPAATKMFDNREVGCEVGSEEPSGDGTILGPFAEATASNQAPPFLSSK